MAEYPWRVAMNPWGVPDIVQRVDYDSGFTINGVNHRYIAKQVETEVADQIVKLHNEQINMMKKGIAYCYADLRHVYSHLVNDRVKDHKQLADGLISPIIKHLEKIGEGPL